MRVSGPILLGLCLGMAACGDKDDHGDSGETDDHGHDDGDDGSSGGGDATAGEAVYAASCAGCHGSSGEGVSGPAMMDVVPHHSETEIIDVVMNGSGGMPGVVSDETDAADVAAYCKATWHE